MKSNNWVNYLFIAFFLLSAQISYSQTRYWVSDVAANWSGDNWANSSNGAPDGGGPPTIFEEARFDANGTGNCTLDVASAQIQSLESTTYTATFEFDGNSLSVNGGNLRIGSGTFSDNTGGGELSVVTGNNVRFYGGIIDVELDVESDDIDLDGAQFLKKVRLEKTGNTNSYGAGNCFFADSTYLLSTAGTGLFRMASTVPDTFNSYLYIESSGTGQIQMAQGSAGNYFNDLVEVVCINSANQISFGIGNGTSTFGVSSSLAIGAGGYTAEDLWLEGITYLNASPLSLTLTSSARLVITNCSFTPVVSFTAPRIQTNSSNYLSDATFLKNGSNDDQSDGGNVFEGNLNLTTTADDYVLFGRILPDTILGNVNLVNQGTDYMYFAHGAAGNYIQGDLNVTNSLTAGNSLLTYLARNADAGLTINGNATLLNQGTGVESRIYFAESGNISLNGDLDAENAVSANVGQIQIAVSSNSNCVINGVTRILNSGSGTTIRTYLGNQGEVTANDSVILLNSSSATNSEIFVAENDTVSINGPLELESSNAASDGIFFGNSNAGVVYLGAGATINTQNFGFGELHLEDVIQTAATDQNFTLDSAAYLYIESSAFGGNFTATAADIYTRETSYQGNLNLTRTSAGTVSINQAGGNYVGGTTTLKTLASGYWLWGNGQPDSLMNSVTIIDSSSSNIYLGYNSVGNYISGNCSIQKNNTGTTSRLYLSDVTGSTLEIDGDLSIHNSANSTNDYCYVADQGTLTVSGDLIFNQDASQTSRVYFGNNAAGNATIGGNLYYYTSDNATNHIAYIGNNGDVSINGTVTIDNNTTANSSDIYIASGSSSNVQIGGVITVDNSGSGTNRRTRLADNGSIVCNDSVIVSNGSDATNSQVYFARGADATGTFNGPIVIDATSTDCDGYEFGTGGGHSSISAGNSIIIGSSGYNASALYLENVTQAGSQPLSLITDDNTYLFSENSVWGGDVVFNAGRVRTDSSTYAGNVTFTKTSASDDYSRGFNHVSGNTTINNQGTGNIIFGNDELSPDTFLLDLTINNSGDATVYISDDALQTYIGGNLIVDNSGVGSNSTVSIAQTTSSSVIIEGDVIWDISSTATNSYNYLGNNGDVQVGGDVEIVNGGQGTNSVVYVANTVESVVDLNGKFDLTNDATASNSTVCYLGNNGDLTIGDSLILINNSSANDNRILCAYNDSSQLTLNGNVLLESTHANSDGILFGISGGTTTLSAGNVIEIGANGFVAGNLYFYYFTQLGNTPQTIETTGTSRFYVDSNCTWNGAVDFTGPELRVNDSRFNDVVVLEKTGTGNDDNGGNYFAQNVTITNSGAANFHFGRSQPDTFMLNLTVNNTGTDQINIANNSLGNYIGGNLIVNHSGSGTYTDFVIASNAASDIVIDGDVTIDVSNTSNGSNSNLGYAGDIVIGGDLSITNSPSQVSNIYIGNQDESTISVAGVARFINEGSGTTSRIFIGNQADITFADSVYVLNRSAATNSEIYLAHDDSSYVIFNGDLVLESSVANCDGMLFGNSGGVSEIASNQDVVISSNGYSSGYLYFFDFTQNGNTEQALTLTGDAIAFLRDNSWDGKLTFSAPSIRAETSRFNDAAEFIKTGASDDRWNGGNYFADSLILRNNGSDYILLGNTNPDSCMSHVLLEVTGDEGIYFNDDQPNGYVAGNILGYNNGVGSSSWIYFGYNNGSTLQIDGNLTLYNSGSATNNNVVVARAGDVIVDGDVFIEATTAQNSNVTLAENSAGDLSINGKTTLINQTSGTTGRMYIGSSGNVVLGDSLYLLNRSTSNNSQIFLANSSTSTLTLNGPVVLESSGANTDGIYFGNSTGSTTLAAGQSMEIASGGFSSGYLRLRNFTSNTAIAQSFTLTTNGTILDMDDCTWAGDLTIASPRLFVDGSTFNGTTVLEKTGSTNDNSGGGNTFNQDVTFSNSGTGYFMQASNSGDDYNADVYYLNVTGGRLYPAYNSDCSYAGDIYLNLAQNITFSDATNGNVRFDGAGPQGVFDLGGTASTILFDRMELDKSADTLTLSTPVNIGVSMDFTDGILVSDQTNILNFTDNATVSSASDASFVYGPVLKTGNEAFTFPVGDSLYRPIAISAPSGTSHSFRAQYFNQNPAPTYTYGSWDLPIQGVSTREYWILDRVNGTSNVNVTLSWGANSGGVGDPNDLLVARWNGSTWANHGNGGVTGSLASGTVTTLSAVTSFSPFTLATQNSANTLPIELISFDATAKEGLVVDLVWETASEINNDYFTVERSLDGLIFQSIAVMAGAGNSNEVNQYFLSDRVPNSGVYFYRLKQTDFDGTFTYSEVKVVEFESDSKDMRWYVSDHQLLPYQKVNDEYVKSVEIYNMAGQLVVRAEEMSGILAPTMAPGAYFIHTQLNSGKTISQKIIWQ